ncbi:AIPR family protein [Staphylococcus epidermidis]|uniref:AIPR family protein n=1 Tax=Staphylococcus TaxID=1279 RepID=UPI0004947075|nr:MULTISPECIES: AIPR family protein [Staphylococcus]HEQ3959355.1 AIPR family protein [Streptococcus pyogenes]MBC2971467.1 AIPR family protein [Staphylococcus epidermidis]MBM6185054.1 AIPR family protein [Staphylococcus epidermidis]MBM6198329.1 AIPR family protein [Staphylococcus epidermidis]MCC3712376.1 AIPR family protein [Staphylococcus hominis]
MANNSALLEAIISDYSKENFPNENNSDRIFEYFATESYFKKYDFSIDEISNGLIGNTNDWGIDGFYIVINNKTIQNIEELKDMEFSRNFTVELYILQYKNSNSFKETVIDKFIVVSPYIFDLEKFKERDSFDVLPQILIEYIEIFQYIIKTYASKFPNVSINFVHASKGETDRVNGNKKLNQNYMKKVEDLKQHVNNYSLGKNTSCSYELIGIEELNMLSQLQKSYSGDLKVSQNPIYVSFGDEKTKQKGYIATVSLKNFFNFLVDYDENNNPILKEYLFESNIRDYQNSTEVNKAIETTLKNKKSSNDFWWLNNGITILADEGSLNGSVFTLENIQIVNGLQTSYSIFNVLSEEKNNENEDRSVFCKIIITQEEESIDSIIKATNSQNSIPASSLRSTDNLQRDIELYLFKKDFFYDRRKNFYKNKKKPRNKIISINYLAQSLTSILEMKPSKARTSPTVLTKSDEDYEKIFNRNMSIEIYYYAIVLRKNVETYLKENFNIKTDIDKDIKNYFYLHLLRITSSLLISDKAITYNKILNLEEGKILEIDNSSIEEAINILKEIIYTEKDKDSNVNLTNFSKSEKLNDLINQKLADYFIDK